METKREKIHSGIFFTLLVVVTATQPFTWFLNFPVAIALLLNWIAEWDWKRKWSQLDTPKRKVLFSSFIALFLIYMIGILYSSNISEAASDVEYKFWFLVAPLVIFTTPMERLNSERLLLLAKIFILSSILLILTNLSISFHAFTMSKSMYQFIYVHLSHFTHPSYSSLHICTAFILSFFLLFVYRQKNARIWRLICKISLITSPFYIFLLQSKAGLIAFLAVVFMMGLYLINQKRKRKGLSVGYVLACIVVPALLFFIIPEPYNRLKTSVRSLMEERSGEEPANGTMQRVAIWKSACAVVKRNPIFGVGVGDVKTEQIKEYKQRGYTHLAESKHNAHNQYLQTLVGLGLVGLFVLLLYLFVPLSFALKNREVVYTLFLIAVIINLFPESMFERKSGADFIALCNALFCYAFLWRKNSL